MWIDEVVHQTLNHLGRCAQESDRPMGRWVSCIFVGFQLCNYFSPFPQFWYFAIIIAIICYPCQCLDSLRAKVFEVIVRYLVRSSGLRVFEVNNYVFCLGITEGGGFVVEG